MSTTVDFEEMARRYCQEMKTAYDTDKTKPPPPPSCACLLDADDTTATGDALTRFLNIHRIDVTGDPYTKYRFWDKNGDGEISSQEFHEMLINMGTFYNFISFLRV